MLRVYDINGREIAKLIDEKRTAGIYEVQFNASEFLRGVYF